jgi:hypothetical protein
MTTRATHSLTLRFAGICTHFRFGFARGVPHRVVLPDASRLTMGLLTVREAEPLASEQVLYYLLPHFAQFEVEGADPELLYVPPLVSDGGAVMRNGDVFGGIRVEVANAVDRELIYHNDTTPNLAEYYPAYSISGDVVLDGRAACYFDVYGGVVSSVRSKAGAAQTLIQMETDGPPQLLVTPLATSNSAPKSFLLPLQSDAQTSETTLVVKNLEAGPEEHSHINQSHGAFDFLLHYLTARGGIPQVIKSTTPGMTQKSLESVTKDELAQVLEKLADLLLAQPIPGSPQRKLMTAQEITPSCSDSQYP